MAEQNYVSIVAGFRTGGEDYKLGDPVPVADIPGGRNLVQNNYVALDNSDEGIQAVERAEAMAAASAERQLTTREEHEETLRKLEEEAAPKRMGDYGEEVEDGPIPVSALSEEEEARILAELHEATPEATPEPDNEEPVQPEESNEDEEPANDEAKPEPDATDNAVEKAEELGVDLATVPGTGKNGRITAPDVEKAAIDEESGG